MRTVLIAAAIFMLAAPAVPASASAAHKPRQTLCTTAYPVRQAVIKHHGKRAPGRNICRQGVRHSDGSVTEATTSQKARYIRAMRRLIAPPPAYMVIRAGPPRQLPAGTLTAHSRANLPWCTWGPESGGDYQASNGTHFGKYQFDQQTWESVGGTGNPLNASHEEQDRRAAILYSRRGGQPWVNCP